MLSLIKALAATIGIFKELLYPNEDIKKLTPLARVVVFLVLMLIASLYFSVDKAFYLHSENIKLTAKQEINTNELSKLKIENLDLLNIIARQTATEKISDKSTYSYDENRGMPPGSCDIFIRKMIRQSILN